MGTPGDVNNLNQAIGNMEIDGSKTPDAMTQDDVSMEHAPAMEEEDAEVEAIDWKRVGRLYKPDSAVDHIVNKEMQRLRESFNQNI